MSEMVAGRSNSSTFVALYDLSNACDTNSFDGVLSIGLIPNEKQEVFHIKLSVNSSYDVLFLIDTLSTKHMFSSQTN